MISDRRNSTGAKDSEPAILIIDDDSNNLAMVSDLLEELGYLTFVAEDGESGIKRAILTRPDLILLDVLMPGIDGFETCRRLKGMEETRDIPVIFMTALWETDQKVMGFQAGAVDYITKPLQREEMLARVGVHLRIRHLTMELRAANELLEKRVAERTLSLSLANEELQKEIAERKSAEEALAVKQGQLEALNSELEQRVSEEVEKNVQKDRILFHSARLTAMGELLSNIAHQWRQPLNNIALLVQGAALEYKAGKLTPDSFMAFSDKSMSILKEMSNTINVFQSFFSPVREPREFDPLDRVEKSIALVRASYEQNGIAISIINDGTVPMTGFDIDFSDVVLAILNNAKDVLVERGITDPAVEIRCASEKGRNIITIGDNAGGIPAEILDKIFDPYFTTKFKSAGAGIGLYMAKMVIERNMAGRLYVRNTAQGAEFCIELPTPGGRP